MLVATGVKACVHRARAACEGKGGPRMPAPKNVPRASFIVWQGRNRKSLRLLS